jgi:hypothetical protein
MRLLLLEEQFAVAEEKGLYEKGERGSFEDTSSFW